jgi:hypothetical protein
MGKPKKKGKSKKSADKKAPKTDAKKKSKKKDDKPHVIDVPHKKKSWVSERELRPETGTRFRANTSQQLAFDITLKGARKGHNVKQIRAKLAAERKETGGQRNLDAGYFNFVVACHPEYFQVWSDGRVEIIAEPEPDPEAVKKAKEADKARKKRASESRNTSGRKKPAKGKAKPKAKKLKKKK